MTHAQSYLGDGVTIYTTTLHTSYTTAYTTIKQTVAAAQSNTTSASTGIEETGWDPPAAGSYWVS